MNYFSLLLGSALTFWGWHTGLWWLGLPLGFLIILPEYMNSHWELSVRERQRIADLCSYAVIVTASYLYFTQSNLANVLILTVQWFPVLFFPMLAMQIYSRHSGTELSILFVSLRKDQEFGNEKIDLRPMYLVLCLLGAAMLPPPGTFFYLDLCIITALALFPFYSNKSRIVKWIAAWSIAAVIGYNINLNLMQLQADLEEYVIAWLTDWYHDDIDPYRTTTAIGDIGRLKLSEQVIFRVWADAPPLSPLLLRSGSFSSYANGTWVAKRTPFTPLHYDAQGWHVTNSKKLENDNDAERWIKIAMELEQGRGILPIPSGSQLLQGLQGAQLSGNDSGIIQVIEGPEFANYQVIYGELFNHEPPQDTDLRVPTMERVGLEGIVTQLNLRTIKTFQAIERIQNLFQRDFSYSLHLNTPTLGQSALNYFLTQQRSGHCEYFATAAVLLLRQAGIPARYVQGWSVQEYSDLEQAYVARARHAHAWVLIWLDGMWQDFDPTPSNWMQLESAARPWWSSLLDVWTWLRYSLANKPKNNQEQSDNLWAISSVIALSLLLAWRITQRGKRIARSHTSKDKIAKIESMFMPIEQALSARTRARYKGETLRHWLNSLSTNNAFCIMELISLMNLYYRQRFDPSGLNEHDTRLLQDGLNNCLIKLR